MDGILKNPYEEILSRVEPLCVHCGLCPGGDQCFNVHSQPNPCIGLVCVSHNSLSVFFFFILNVFAQQMLFHSFPDFVLYHREMWPATPIFLCLWHVRCAWQKHSCYKIKDIAQRAEILQELGSMMYDKTSPGDSKSATWASEKLQELSKKYPKHKDFWDYMIKQWQDKAHM